MRFITSLVGFWSEIFRSNAISQDCSERAVFDLNMVSAVNGIKRRWDGNFDLVPSFSDSDDIPDLDGDLENEEDAEPQQKRKRKSGSNGLASKKKVKQQSPSSGDEDEDAAKWTEQGTKTDAFDPSFQFDNAEAGGVTVDGFDAWGEIRHNDMVRVGVDDIIRRRAERKKVENAVQESEEDDDDEELAQEPAGELDEEEALTEDAFGMGAVDSEDDGSSNESSDERDVANINGDPTTQTQVLQNGDANKESEDDDNSVAEPVPHPNDLIVSDQEDEPEEDHIEAAKRDAFFEKAQPKVPLLKTLASFQSMHLSRPILKGLNTIGFTEPTPIQAKTVPMALLGKDVVGGAVTGSGKTAAFVLPILERLLYRPNKVPSTRVAVLTPTRELAVQCHSVATKLAQYTDITLALIVGGLSLREQEVTLRKRPDIVIATPGRFIDHTRNSASFAVDSIEILILDEADRMLEDGFADELNELLKTIPRSRQTMLFSATMTSGVDDLIRAGLNKPVRLVVDAERSTVSKLVQEFVKIKPSGTLAASVEPEHHRLAYLLHLCTHTYTARTIVFLPTKHLAHRVKVLFALRGLAAAELHGSMSQEQRLGAISAFRDGRATHLLATDLASRGLDIPRVETVINYTVPTTSTTYLHRVGRTARAGRTGVSVTLYDSVKKLEKQVSKGPKGVGGKTTASERSLLRPILKIAKGQKAPLRTRSMPPDAVEELEATIAGLQDEIDGVLKEEKEERLLAVTERDMKKGENLMKYEEEIKGRPRRTWFQSAKEKKGAQGSGAEERLAAGDGETREKRRKRKLSGKDRKRLELRDERREGSIIKKNKKALINEEKNARKRKRRS